jgi:hypothetical protein
MLYQSNMRRSSTIEPYDIMVLCDRCGRPITSIHWDNIKEIIKEGSKKENVCLICRKREREKAVLA